MANTIKLVLVLMVVGFFGFSSSFLYAGARSKLFNDSVGGLNQAQQRSVDRFLSKAPSNVHNRTYHGLSNGGVKIEYTSPARTSGYAKTYEKTIDSAGSTTGFGKHTYGPSGLINRKK